MLTILREDQLGKIRLPGSMEAEAGEDVKAETKKEAVGHEGDRKED